MYKYTGKISWTIIKGKKYALGGDVHIERTPPKLPETIKECTQEEYEFLYKLGFPQIEQIDELKPLLSKKRDSGSN